MILTTLGWVWFVASHVAELVIVVAVLRAGETSFQQIVLSSLVIVYLDTVVGLGNQSRLLLDLYSKSSRQFLAIASLLKDPAQSDYRDGYEEGRQALARGTPKLIAGLAFRYCEHAFAAVVLVRALF